MIIAYNSTETDFSKNGLGPLDKILKSAYIIKKLNDDYRLDLEVIIDNEGRHERIDSFNIIKADGQLFRIPDTSKIQDNGFTKQVSAPHIFYDLNNNFNEDRRAEGVSVKDALTAAVEINNKFLVLECDDLGNNNAYFVEENPVASIFNKILPRWGGELFRDNYTLAIKSRIGRDTGELIAYGKNILGFKQINDTKPIATKIYLKGKDGITIDGVNNGDKFLTSPRVGLYPFTITKKVEFTDIDNPLELKNAGLSLWGDIDLPLVNFEIKFKDLRKTDQYKRFAFLQELDLGDSVKIRHEKFGVDITARIIYIKKNLLTDEIEEMELGQFRDSLTSKLIHTDNKIDYAQGVAEDAAVRLKDVELKVTSDSIVATVRNSDGYKSDLQVLSDEISAKVSKDEIASEIVQHPDEIRASVGVVGIENLLHDSGFELGEAKILSSTGSVNYSNIMQDSINNIPLMEGSKCCLYLDTFNKSGDAYVNTNMEVALIKGQTYTLSYYYCASGAITNHSSYIYTPNGAVGFGEPYQLDQKWHRFSMQYTHQYEGTITLRFGIISTGDAWLAIDNVLITEGKNLVGWHPNSNEIKTVNVVLNQEGLDIQNGAITISNNGGDKVFKADTGGNIVMKGYLVSGGISSLDGTVQIDLASGFFQIGKYAIHNQDSSKWIETNGHYSIAKPQGFFRDIGGGERAIKCLDYMVQRPGIKNGSTTTIVLPGDFQDKELNTDFTVLATHGNFDSSAWAAQNIDAVRTIFVNVVSWNGSTRELVVQPCMQKIGIASRTLWGWDSGSTTPGNTIGEGAIDVIVIARI